MLFGDLGRLAAAGTANAERQVNSVRRTRNLFIFVGNSADASKTRGGRQGVGCEICNLGSGQGRQGGRSALTECPLIAILLANRWESGGQSTLSGSGPGLNCRGLFLGVEHVAGSGTQVTLALGAGVS